MADSVGNASGLELALCFSAQSKYEGIGANGDSTFSSPFVAEAGLRGTVFNRHLQSDG